MVSHCHFLLIQNNKFDIILLSILSLTLSKSIPHKSILLLNAKICHRCLTFYNTNPSDNPRVSIPREFGCMFAVHFLEPLLISRLTKNLIPTGALLCHVHTRVHDSRSLGSLCIKGSNESVPRVDSSDPLMHHGSSDLGS